MRKSVAAVIICIITVLLLGLTYAEFIGFPIGIYDVNPLHTVIRHDMDTQGSYTAVYSLSDSTKTITDEEMAKAVRIFQERLDKAGYTNATAAAYGDRQILVKVAIDANASSFLQYLGAIGEVGFYNSSDKLILGKDNIKNATYYVSNGYPYAYFEFDEVGKTEFASATKTAAASKASITIKMDGTTLTSNSVGEAITTGTCGLSFSGADAVVAACKTEKLPAAFKTVDNFTVSGVAGNNADAVFGICGLAIFVIAVLFLIIRYKSLGIAPVLAMWTYVLLMLALITIDIAGITLTTPVVAAFIVGMILFVFTQSRIFEGVYEQIATGKPARASFKSGMSEGMKQARLVNYALFILSMIVYAFGTTGLVQFAVTLMLAILSGLIITSTVTRGLSNCVLAFNVNPTAFGKKNA